MSLGAAYGAIRRDYFGRGGSTPSAKVLYKMVTVVGGYGVAHRRLCTAVLLCICVLRKSRTSHVIKRGERDYYVQVFRTEDWHTECKSTV